MTVGLILELIEIIMAYASFQYINNICPIPEEGEYQLNVLVQSCVCKVLPQNTSKRLPFIVVAFMYLISRFIVVIIISVVLIQKTKVAIDSTSNSN